MDTSDGTVKGAIPAETFSADKCADLERPRPEGADDIRRECTSPTRPLREDGEAGRRGGSAGSQRSQSQRGTDRNGDQKSRSDSGTRKSRGAHRAKQHADGTEARQSGTDSDQRENGLPPKSLLPQFERTAGAAEDTNERRGVSEEEEEEDVACSVVHIHTIAGETVDKGSPSSGGDSESKKMAKLGRKLRAKKMEYRTEKQLLKSKMETARKEFEQEVRKYEQALDGKRQEMLRELSVAEEHSALAQRLDELAGFRAELDARFAQNADYEKEIEEIERYLDRRQELCNSREEDLRLLDEQLDTLNQELELDKERLKRAGFDEANMAPRKRSVISRSPQKGSERDKDDYILKANLRKCQGDLKKAEQLIRERDAELAQATEEISSLQLDGRKKQEKIKQLETQLSLALSQLKGHAQSSVAATTPPRPTINRHTSLRSHVSLDRSPAELSINQRAQLNRTLSVDGRGGGFGSPVGSTGSPEGNKRASSYRLGGPGSSTEGAAGTQQQTVSTACSVM